MSRKSSWKSLATEAIASLSPAEREASIAYLEQRVVPAGEVLAWPGLERSFDEAVVIAFIDLEPALNWTHRGRYLVLGADGGIREILATDLPPFLRRVSPQLRVVHRGPRAPEWAAVAPPLGA